MRRNNRLNTEEIEKIFDGVTSDEIDFREALNKFLEDCNIRNLRGHTIKFYQNELSTFYKIMKEQGIEPAPSSITSEHIKRNVILYMKEEQERKIVTINARIRAVRSFFNFLHREGYIRKNPVQGIKLLKDRKQAVETFSREQLKELFKIPDLRTFTGMRDYVLMSLLLETGIRANECIGITVRDVNLKEGTVLIRNAKTYKERLVPIQKPMQNLLTKYLHIRGRVEDTDALFLTIDGTPMSKRQLQNRITFYGRKADIQGVRCSAHTFRHTFAKLSVKAGADIFILQAILGHSSMEMVRNYVNLFSDDVLEKHKDFSPLKNLKSRL
ncbi:tyrosine-type recombinase/integrase [Alteribacillus sp. YIM 98480]|uniref:tyrosine-type recombinase/integrase n=1 Tax=Alteribacillus sp. YIM 98480 TaxID=2606599 RepID=UPI00131C85C2|nr:tyrosine-type recombinase/integrase [Alteribacillus sp. YIM 98480]